MKNFDAIIIGGGLGGLTAGAKLAKEGRKVLLLEQHYIPGGCATTFKRKDFIMEVGLHETEGFTKDDFKTEIFADLKVLENVEFLRLPEFYRYKNDRIDIVIPDDQEKAIAILTEKFPAEQKGIKKFFKTIFAIQREIKKLSKLKKWQQVLLLPVFPIFFPYLAVISKKFPTVLNPIFLLLHGNLIFQKLKTVGDFLDSIIEDEDLKLVLQANLGYYHDDPYSMSLIYFSAAQAGYYRGGYFIKGGSQKLSDYLAKIITDNGGEVLLGVKAQKIIVEDGRARGVEYQNTFGKEPTTKQIFAKNIIANAAVPNILKMLPTENQKKLEQKTKKLEIACSLISIYIGFRRNLKELNKRYSTFISDGSVKNLKDVNANAKADFTERGFVFVDYSQIDSGLAPADKTFGTICTYDYLKNWENLGEEEYKKKKEEVAQTLFERLEKEIPGIRKEIEYYEIGTPKTIQRYTLNPKGTAYGFAQIPQQTGLNRLPNKSPIKNLYLASAWANPGGGFTGAIMSGWLCSREVLSRTKKAEDLVLPTEQLDNSKIKFVEKKEIAENTLELTFEKPKNFNFEPGQYAVLKIDQSKCPDNDIYHRPLSIVSHPEEKVLRFAMRKSESGFKKSCDFLVAGDSASIFGPKGEFFLPEKIVKPIVFLVGGIGITPILAMLKELEKRNSENKIWLFYSNKTEESSAYLKELEKIQLPNYKMFLNFTKTGKRIDAEFLKNNLEDLQKCDFYIMGTTGFNNAMKEILLQNNVSDLSIKTDNFG